PARRQRGLHADDGGERDPDLPRARRARGPRAPRVALPPGRRSGRPRMNADALAAFLASTCVMATPLLLAAIGELVSERAALLNVGLEGLVLLGAFAAFAVDLATGDATLACGAAAAAGAIPAALLALLAVGLGADAVVAGTALNLLALGVTATLYRRLY